MVGWPATLWLDAHRHSDSGCTGGRAYRASTRPTARDGTRAGLLHRCSADFSARRAPDQRFTGPLDKDRCRQTRRPRRRARAGWASRRDGAGDAARHRSGASPSDQTGLLHGHTEQQPGNGEGYRHRTDATRLGDPLDAAAEPGAHTQPRTTLGGVSVWIQPTTSPLDRRVVAALAQTAPHESASVGGMVRLGQHVVAPTTAADAAGVSRLRPSVA